MTMNNALLNYLQVFDINGITIESIRLDDEHGTHLHYTMEHEVNNYGKKLNIFIPLVKEDHQSERYVNIFSSIVFYLFTPIVLIGCYFKINRHILHMIPNTSGTL